MTSSAAGPARPTLAWTELRTPAVEAFGQLALIGLALAVVGRQDPAGWAARTTAVLVLAAGVAAAVLLATAGRVSDNRRAVRMAGAVGVHAAVVLLPTAAGAGPATGAWSVATSVALLGVVGFLALAVRASADRRGDRISATLVAAVVAVAAAAAAALARQAPELVPPGWVVLAADLVVWSGTASAAGLMVLAGAVADRALLRGTGLAFATLALANAVRIGTGGPVVPALELAAMTMLLVVAVRFGRAGVATAAGCRARLVEAENALAGSRTATADRDQELRELVAALSGATRELAGDGRLPAAAAAGFDRLRDLVDAGSGPLRAPLGPVLHDIAEVHRANGLDVRVEVDGDPDALVEVGAVTGVLTRLLVDCAEQAPGAQVWLRAEPTAGRLRIEVVDDGPGLPPEAVTALLQRGGSGPRPVGPVPAPGAGLVDRHRGALTITPVDGDPGGCTAVLELPVTEPVEYR